MRELVRSSKALADETRIRMLKLLLENDVCVCEMEEILPISHSQVSRNLRMLMDAGFLKRWHEGRCVVYIADKDTNNKFCQTFLDTLALTFNDDEVVSRDREVMREVKEQGVREKRK